MNIILVGSSRSKLVKRQLNSPLHFLILFLFFFSIMAAVASGGYWYASNQNKQQQQQWWTSELGDQKAHIENMRDHYQAETSALTKRLGTIQGYLTRLDALGSKLVTMAKLDKNEFSFASAPALGGVETSESVTVVTPAEMKKAIDLFEEELQQREQQLEVLEHLIMSRNLEEEASPSGRPIKKGWLSSPYGSRISPFTGLKQHHKGVDFAGKDGRDIVAVAGGVITFAGSRHNYGTMIEVNHGSGYVTRYAHNKTNILNVGNRVKKGQVIAKMGSTGRSTGPHVHFEVIKNGKHVNPKKFINANQ